MAALRASLREGNGSKVIPLLVVIVMALLTVFKTTFSLTVKLRTAKVLFPADFKLNCDVCGGGFRCFSHVKPHARRRVNRLTCFLACRRSRKPVSDALRELRSRDGQLPEPHLRRSAGKRVGPLPNWAVSHNSINLLIRDIDHICVAAKCQREGKKRALRQMSLI